MKTRILLGASVLLTLAAIMACEPTANNSNTANANRAIASNNSNNTSTVNSVTNTIANAVDSVTGNTDEDFLKDADIAGLSEIELSKLAETKSTNADIKKFAQMMVADHTKVGDELKALAKKKNVEVAAETDSSHKSHLTDLQAKSGADFDKAYVEQMVSDHEGAVKLFKGKADGAQGEDVKAFAAKNLPTLQKHLDAINGIQAKMK